MPRTVLVVDDDASITMSLSVLMRREGYLVQVAHDGAAALDCARERAPDLVLLDAHMPQRDGFEVCEALRADPACAETRIMMLSARCSEVEIEKCAALGADDFMPKPFSRAAIADRVRALMDFAHG